MLIAMGKDRNDRKYFSRKDTEGFEIISSVTSPINGYHGKDYWSLYYKIPLSFFEKCYNEKFCGEGAIANFYNVEMKLSMSIMVYGIILSLIFLIFMYLDFLAILFLNK